jgi:hypothetical protein
MKIEYETVVACSPEQVWAVFSDLSNWSQWNSMTTASWAQGDPWQADSELLLEPAQPAVKVKARVLDCAPPYSVRWRGRAMGVSVVHSFEFAAQPGGSTFMKTVVELSGPATFFISNKMKQQGVDIFAQWFNALKAEAEKRASHAIDAVVPQATK